MTIAILAHDSRKELALQFCTAYSGILSEFMRRMRINSDWITYRWCMAVPPVCWKNCLRRTRYLSAEAAENWKTFLKSF